MPSCLEHRLFFFLIVTMAWSAVMQLELRQIPPSDFKKPLSCSHFSNVPIIDVELASSADCFLSVVQQGIPENLKHNTTVLQVNTYMDFFFIGLYWTVFVLFARADRDPLLKDDRWSNWVISFISASAIFDILENTRILKGLSGVLAAGHAQGMLPRPFSLVKWTTLALALGCLGALVWSRAGRLRRWLSGALFASGVITILGLFVPQAMPFTALGFAAVLVLSIVRFWPYTLETFLIGVEYAYLMRFPILAALILAAALPISYYVVPSVFVGLFDGRGFWSFVFIVWAAFQLAWTIMVTCRLLLVYGPDRFVRAKSIKVQRVGIRTVSSFGLLAVPLLVVLYLGTAEPRALSKSLATLLGLVVAICVLGVTAFLHFAIENKGKSAELIFPSFGFLETKERTHQSWFWRFVGSSLARLGPDLTAGIVSGDRLRSGHEMAMMALGTFLVVYGTVGWFFSPSSSTPEHQPAAMFFLLFLLTIFTWFLSGAAFFLDRTRLPVFTTLLAVSLLTGFVRTDHEFVITQADTRDVGMLSPSEVIHSWENGKRSKNGMTITIVATAGGGIRAAAWTAEVMTRLQQHCGALSSSVLLVSSVSGGSVGSMFVVGPYSSKDGSYPTTDAELYPIRFNASRSSLSAVGWGLAYPDLARTAPFVGSLIRQRFDRGWSLENAWATAWRDAGQKEPVMSQWREDVRHGMRPAVIFNATSSESGERFLIASTDVNSKGAVRFFDRFPDSDIGVATAARLSATFPYVSPLARASAGTIENAYHVGDGGYYDNSGLLSAVEWLRDAKDALHNYKVLLILIDAKPGNPKKGSSWSWQKQIIGPVETLLHVRTSSQQVRDSIELDMATDYLGSQTPKVDLIAASFLFSSDSAPPLSWHLTERQIQEIGSSWEDPQNVTAADLVYGVLGCRADKR